jgi:hypothetical protein
MIGKQDHKTARAAFFRGKFRVLATNHIFPSQTIWKQLGLFQSGGDEKEQKGFETWVKRLRFPFALLLITAQIQLEKNKKFFFRKKIV